MKSFDHGENMQFKIKISKVWVPPPYTPPFLPLPVLLQKHGAGSWKSKGEK